MIRASLETLRSQLQSQLYPQAFCSFSRVSQGLPKGGLTEIRGPHRLDWTLSFLAEHPELLTAWVEEKFEVYPPALLQRGVSLERLLFLEAQKEVLSMGLDLLKSQVFPVVVLRFSFLSEKSLRKLQLASQKSENITLLLPEAPLVSWPFRLRINTTPTHSLRKWA